jgi:hypothetical protein
MFKPFPLLAIQCPNAMLQLYYHPGVYNPFLNFSVKENSTTSTTAFAKFKIYFWFNKRQHLPTKILNTTLFVSFVVFSIFIL